jgi:hypothetical protein
LEPGISSQKLFTRVAHFQVRLNSDYLSPGLKKKAREDPGTGTDIGHYGPLAQAALIAEQLDYSRRIAWAEPLIVLHPRRKSSG